MCIVCWQVQFTPDADPITWEQYATSGNRLIHVVVNEDHAGRLNLSIGNEHSVVNHRRDALFNACFWINCKSYVVEPCTFFQKNFS